MDRLTLVIGNKNYSSWSLRPWLLLKQADIPFREIRIPLYTPTSQADIRQHSPSGKVPVLMDGSIIVWESLSICEYLAEKFPKHEWWPADISMRAQARAISAEMHTGFTHLRHHLPMNCRKRFSNNRIVPAVKQDIERIGAIWNDCRRRAESRGPFLFGSFGIADAMYAPVVLRFVTYDVRIDSVCNDYVNTICRLPAIQEWLTDAVVEVETISQFEFDPQQT